MKTNLKKSLLALWVAFMIGLTACGSTPQVEPPSTSVEPITQSQTETAETTASDQTVPTDSSSYSTDISDLPVYSGEPYVPINNNIPAFTDSDFTTTSFEHYSELDSLGRCGVAFANVGQDLMPTEERGSIGQVKPTGWHTVKYSHVDGQYLFNRCHLLGFQLTAENANVKNLITGTRYLNVTGMLPFENMVADYIKETNNHVLYRVTPIFEGNNLVANGVRWKPCPSRTGERVLSSTSSAIMFSQVSLLTMQRVKATRMVPTLQLLRQATILLHPPHKPLRRRL